MSSRTVPSLANSGLRYIGSSAAIGCRICLPGFYDRFRRARRCERAVTPGVMPANSVRGPPDLTTYGSPPREPQITPAASHPIAVSATLFVVQISFHLWKRRIQTTQRNLGDVDTVPRKPSGERLSRSRGSHHSRQPILSSQIATHYERAPVASTQRVGQE